MSDHTNSGENGNLTPPSCQAFASAPHRQKCGKIFLAVKKSTKNKRTSSAGHEAV